MGDNFMDKYAEYQVNEKLLSNREKKVNIFKVTDKRHFFVKADMHDAIHQLCIYMFVKEPSLIIEDIDCDMIRVPDSVCFKAQDTLKSMIGRRVSPGITKEMNKWPAYEKCTHLIDLFRDACYNITLAQSAYAQKKLKESYPGITEEQIYKIFFWTKPDLKNTCIRYSEHSPFMERVKNVEPPPGSEKIKKLAETRQHANKE